MTEYEWDAYCSYSDELHVFKTISMQFHGKMKECHQLGGLGGQQKGALHFTYEKMKTETEDQRTERF